ncbi:MAG: hypothetical protein KME64_03220 [Scytonematopsis contorta HA4267-MV1]|jgi:hypothetical protein|nr:hypothetical protein [Scytonematopsis contorta HA4267-MV1]
MIIYQNNNSREKVEITSISLLSALLFDSLCEDIKLIINQVNYTAKLIEGASREKALEYPRIQYYSQEPKNENITLLPNEFESDVIYRELTITTIEDLEYFIDKYQGDIYILEIENLSFGIHRSNI